MIGADGERLGILARERALAIADEADLDLVEVGPGEVPTARLMNYSHEQFRKERLARAAAHKNAAHNHVTEIQLRPAIAEHDLTVKAATADRALAKGHRVKVVVVLHGRYASRPEVAVGLLERFYAQLNAGHSVDSTARSERSVTTVLKPAATHA